MEMRSGSGSFLSIVLRLPIKPQLNSKTLKAWGQKDRKAKNKQNKNCRKTHKLLRLKRQESKYLLSSLLFLPLTGSASFRLLPRVSFSVQFYRLSIEKLAIY
jgi:hypothetical protein